MIRRAFRPVISLLLLIGLAAHSESGDFSPTPTLTTHGTSGEAEAVTSKENSPLPGSGDFSPTPTLTKQGNLKVRQKPSLPDTSQAMFCWTKVPAPFSPHPPTNQTCHDSYSAASFEAANDDLQEFIDEYFYDAKIPFFPSEKQLRDLGLVPKGKGIYQKSHALKVAGGHRRYPVTPGLWKAVDLGGGVWEYHLLIREPQRLAETEAFNTDNDLLGEPFADYDNQAYIMLLQPEDVRRRFEGHFFTINVHIYGLRDDATTLPFTVSDIILTDYTAWVEQNRRCQAQGQPS